MSNVPYYLRGMRGGVKFGDRTVQDGLVHDGLWCSFGDCHMGGHAEYTAAKAGITRAEADAFAYASHRKAVAAIDEGGFAAGDRAGHGGDPARCHHGGHGRRSPPEHLAGGAGPSAPGLPA